MLQLKNIKKVYGKVGENEVHALKGIDINFRECEFVSILGPSGCGKTTLLNIIGGLDVASDGDLIFDGVSTKGYTDADWDDYRNSKIGFVFQTYNLIPHLTVLDNVALALTISGVTGEERIRRATKAIEAVGLKEQLHKLPSQMSGGQVQRVAIARAMVNETPLLLADEPTGAIDSETSVQVMDLLKEISKTRLVIMVTHNAELAERYSTRIVRVLDGEIISDTDPYYPDEESAENTERVSNDALIEAKTEENAENEAPLAELENTESVLNDDVESSAVKAEESSAVETEENEAAKVEESEAAKVEDSAGESIADNASKEVGKGGKRRGRSKKSKKMTTMSFGAAVKLSWRNLISKRGRSMLTAIAGSIGIICIALILAVNNGFSNYIAEFEKTSLSKYPVTVTTGEDNVTSMLERLQEQLTGNTDSMNIFDMLGEIDADDDAGQKFPSDKMMRIYAMFANMLKAFMEDSSKTKDISLFKKQVENLNPEWGDVKFDYSLNLDIYRRNTTEREDGGESVSYTKINPMSESDVMLPLLEGAFSQMPDDMAEQMRSAATFLDTFAFWDELVGDDKTILSQYDVIEGRMPKDKNEIVIVLNEYNQISDFDAFALNEMGLGDMLETITDPSKISNFDKAFEDVLKMEYVVLPTSSSFRYNEMTGLYTNIRGSDPIAQATRKNVLEQEGIKLKITGILRPKPDLQHGCINGVIGYTSMLGDAIMQDALNAPYVVEMQTRLQEYYQKLARQAEVLQKFAESGSNYQALAPEEITIMTTPVQLIDAATGAATSIDDYNTLMRRLNVRDLDKPSYIYIYASSVSNKNKISAFIDEFNANVAAHEAELEEQVDEDGQKVRLTYTNVVAYTDDLDAIVHDMDTMVNTITYILIAVALVSVIVTMFLVAIIMYISVQDRTREIGILRALGARKMDISSIFNVETLILGLFSGVIGVLIAFILQFPGNAITAATLNLKIVVMAWWHPFVLIFGAMFITLIAGLIPALIAAKKQPVIALRTEG